jgi:hypothetical protein
MKIFFLTLLLFWTLIAVPQWTYAFSSTTIITPSNRDECVDVSWRIRHCKSVPLQLHSSKQSHLPEGVSLFAACDDKIARPSRWKNAVLRKCQSTITLNRWSRRIFGRGARNVNTSAAAAAAMETNAASHLDGKAAIASSVPPSRKPNKFVTFTASLLAAMVLRPAKALAGGGGMVLAGPVVPLERCVYLFCSRRSVCVIPILFADLSFFLACLLGYQLRFCCLFFCNAPLFW